MYDVNSRKRLEVAPTVAFGAGSRHHRERRFSEFPSMSERGTGGGAPWPSSRRREMKDDAAGATELEALLRDALNDLETPRGGGSPILQLRTVPLQLQDIAPARARAAAVAVAPAPVEGVPESSSRLVSESIPPKAMATKAKASAQAKRGKSKTTTGHVAAAAEPRRSRASLYAVLTLGAIALAAAGGAAWRARPHAVVPVATAETTVAPVAAPVVTAEGALGIAVASRPADAPKDDAAKPEDKALAANPITARVDSRPEGKPAEIRRDPQAPAPVAIAKPAAQHHSALSPRAEAKAPPMVPDKPAAATVAAPPPPAPASVDALVQQQLKGAIP